MKSTLHRLYFSFKTQLFASVILLLSATSLHATTPLRGGLGNEVIDSVEYNENRLGIGEPLLKPAGELGLSLIWLQANRGVYNNNTAKTSVAKDGEQVIAWSNMTSKSKKAAISSNVASAPLFQDNVLSNINFNPTIAFNGITKSLHLRDEINTSVNKDMSVYAVIEAKSSKKAKIVHLNANHLLGNQLNNAPVSFNKQESIIEIGRSGKGKFVGNMAEVILFDHELKQTEQIKVESYLGLKYGITNGSVAQPFNYTASNGTIYRSRNLKYGNDIAGIGRDDKFGLYQKQSMSVNDGAVLLMGINNSISASNKANKGVFEKNLSFLTWGNNNGGLKEVYTNVPKEFSGRLEREWKVNKTGKVPATLVVVDLSKSALKGKTVSDFELLIDTDGDGDFTTGTIHRVAANLYSSGMLRFENVELGNEQVFTIGTTKSRVLTAPLSF